MKNYKIWLFLLFRNQVRVNIKIEVLKIEEKSKIIGKLETQINFKDQKIFENEKLIKEKEKEISKESKKKIKKIISFVKK